MLKASREMGFGDDWKAALEKVKTLHVEPGKQPDLIRDLAREAEDYVEKRDLVTVPPLAKEDWRMEMMSPERQKVSPFFLGGEMIQVSYPHRHDGSRGQDDEHARQQHPLLARDGASRAESPAITCRGS